MLAMLAVRQFVPRRAYQMLIKRVSTVSKYLTAAAARRGATMDRSTGAELRAGHGIVFGEPWSLMYASGLARWSRGTVWVVHVLLPRHSPMLRALLCALYTLSRCPSFSFSLRGVSDFLRLALSSHRRSFSRSSIAAFRSFPRILPSPSRPDSPVARVIRTRERSLFLCCCPFLYFFPYISLSLPFSPFPSSSPVSSLFRAHLAIPR